MKYTVVIEKAAGNYSAYVPDLPSDVATDKNTAEAEVNIRETIALHIESLRADGEVIPQPSSRFDYVHVAV